MADKVAGEGVFDAVVDVERDIEMDGVAPSDKELVVVPVGMRVFMAEKVYEGVLVIRVSPTELRGPPSGTYIL